VQGGEQGSPRRGHRGQSVDFEQFVAGQNPVHRWLSILSGDPRDQVAASYRFQRQADLVDFVRIEFALPQPVGHTVGVINGQTKAFLKHLRLSSR
jgi:hypothetical protein